MKGVALRQLKLKTLFTDGGSRGMATGADIMCGRINTDTPTKPLAPEDEKTRTQTAESSSSLSISTIDTPAMEVEGELLKVPGSSWTSKKPQKWWRPDPATGTWVPEGHEGQVTTSTDATKSASRTSVCHRSETSASMVDKRSWWTSMEELPDMDRAK